MRADYFSMKAIENYHRDGFCAPIPVLNKSQSRRHRKIMEAAEQRLGGIHYQAKIHTVLRSAYKLATHPAILDLVEEILGRNILLYDSTYIIKEPHSESYVSWHQDLAYWGLSDDAQVSAWLALSPANEKSGCMKMLPGSHKAGSREHIVSCRDPNNVLLQSQRVAEVDEDGAVHCPLQPGQASLHHGWTLHCSAPNASADRRIGLNVQYVATHVRQTKLPGMSAMLVRGEDKFGYYEKEIPPRKNLEARALEARARKDELYRNIAGSQ